MSVLPAEIQQVRYEDVTQPKVSALENFSNMAAMGIGTWLAKREQARTDTDTAFKVLAQYGMLRPAQKDEKGSFGFAGYNWMPTAKQMDYGDVDKYLNVQEKLGVFQPPMSRKDAMSLAMKLPEATWNFDMYQQTDPKTGQKSFNPALLESAAQSVMGGTGFSPVTGMATPAQNVFKTKKTRQQAIEFLKKNNKPADEPNIQYLLSQQDGW